MGNIGKLVTSIIGGLVFWRVSDALLNMLNQSIDNTITHMGNDVGGMLTVLKAVVNFMSYDISSFVLTIILYIMLFLRLAKSNGE